MLYVLNKTKMLKESNDKIITQIIKNKKFIFYKNKQIKKKVLEKTQKLFMLKFKQQEILDKVPICHNAFFKTQESYIAIQSSRSFSKSSQKKLKLISNPKSLQKSHSLIHSISHRKIKPLKVKVSSSNTSQLHLKQQQSTKRSLCSIKNYKTKISQMTQYSKIKIDTEVDSSINLDNKLAYCHQDQFKAPPIISTRISGRSLGTQQNNSLEIKQQASNNYINNNLENLLFDSVGNQLSFTLTSSPTNRNNISSSNKYSIGDSSQQLTMFLTPIKQRSPTKKQQSYKENKLLLMTSDYTPFHLSPLQREIEMENKVLKKLKIKKQILTLHSARKVQTFQTLKTQNNENHSSQGIKYSFIDDEDQCAEYKNILNRIAFPDYFTPRIVGLGIKESQWMGTN